MEAIIESGCKCIIEGIKENYIAHTELGVIVYLCKHRLFSFLNFETNFVRKQANFVVHLLVRAAKFHICHQIYYYILSYIETHLLFPLQNFTNENHI